MDEVLAALGEPWPLRRVAAVAGYSPYHFQRLFSHVMGETPQRFVLPARLERAVALLHADPGLPLTQAAAAAGFATQAQLSRAFRARFGAAPSAWDRSAPLRERRGHPVLAGFPVRTASGEPAAVAVRPLPGFSFAYRRIRDPYGNGRLVEAWEDLRRWSGERALVGMSWDDPDVVPAEQCRYDLGVVLGAVDPSPPGTTRRWIPSCTVAALRVRGDIGAVDAAWQRLYRQWLPRSPHGRAALPAMEWFHADPAASGWTAWDLDCLVPVLPYRKIRQASGLRGRRRSS